MLKYNPIEIYALVWLCAAVVTACAYWLVLYIRDRRLARRNAENARMEYIAKLRRERDFYRLQYQTRDALDKYEQTVAFEKMLRGAGK